MQFARKISLVLAIVSVFSRQGVAQDSPPLEAFPWGEELDEWVEIRLENARLGQVELVRIPITLREYWACSCPNYYLGTDSSSHMGGPWLYPIEIGDAEIPRTPEEYDGDFFGDVFVAEGYFTANQMGPNQMGPGLIC